MLIDHLLPTLAAHAGFNHPALIAFTEHLGRAGVLAFFVHTSLVLMYSMERMARSAGRFTLRFYVRRFFRIYPLAIFCITLSLILHVPDVTTRAPDIITTSMIFSNLLLMQNIFGRRSILAPLWSLPFEVQMYLVLPSLYFVSSRKNAIVYLTGMLLVFCCLGLLIGLTTGGRLNMAEFIPCFLSGVLCYAVRDRSRAFLSALLWPLFLIVLILGYSLVTELHRGGIFWIGWIYCLILGLTINSFHDSTLRWLNVIAERIALYSYGVYLLHVPVLYFVFIVMGVKNLILGPLLFFAFTIAASIVTYYGIESPFIGLGAKLSSGLVRRPASDLLQTTP